MPSYEGRHTIADYGRLLFITKHAAAQVSVQAWPSHSPHRLHDVCVCTLGVDMISLLDAFRICFVCILNANHQDMYIYWTRPNAPWCCSFFGKLRASRWFVCIYSAWHCVHSKWQNRIKHTTQPYCMQTTYRRDTHLWLLLNPFSCSHDHHTDLEIEKELYLLEGIGSHCMLTCNIQ